MKLLILLFISLLTTPSFAFKYSPMSLNLATSGKKKTSLVKVENDSNSPIAIEVHIAKRVMDRNGKEKHPREDKLFQVYPPQIILKAKSKRSIKIS